MFSWLCLQLEPGVPLPSPNQLKRKILVKNKRLIPEDEKCECFLALFVYCVSLCLLLHDGVMLAATVSVHCTSQLCKSGVGLL